MIGSQAAYARHRKERGLIGGTRRAVQKALASGRITAGSNGQIDFERADRDWEQNLNHRKRPARREQSQVQPHESSSPSGDISTESFLEAQRRHEWLKVQKEELALCKRRGELAEVSEIEEVWGHIVSATQDRLLGLPGKLAPRLASVVDVHECQQLLDREIRQALSLLIEYQPNAA